MQSHRKPLGSIQRTIILAIVFSLLPMAISSQHYTLTNNEGEVLVTGTSTLHDWEEVAEQKSGILTLDTSGDLPNINSLKFTVESESLKSGKGAMDKNTYKALKTNDFKQIAFELKQIKSISPIVSTANRYKVVAVGDLTISGTTKTIDLPFNLTFGENKVMIDGKKPLKMTDYNIEPPKALLGTITTGDAIEVHFNTIWK